MDKKSFINYINYEDKTIISSIYDKVILSEKCGKTIFTNDFLPPVLWNSLLKLKQEFDIEIEAFGVFEDAERRMLAFTSSAIEQYPIDILKITNKSQFSTLKHKDYLGAVMALGIKREKLGDFILNENHCYVPVCSEISDYILFNLQTVGKNPCEVTVISDLSMEMPSVNLEDMTIISSSLRVDCIVSELCNLSRNSATEIIKQGKVQINYEPIYEKDYMLKDNSVLTVRGYGKFKFCSQISETSKGRLKIKIQKYK